MLAGFKKRVVFMRDEAIALSYAIRDPRTPLLAKIFAGVIIIYVLSPYDLIPDFIPFIGLLDEVVIVPFALRLVLRMIPHTVMTEARSKAQYGYKKIQKIFWIAGTLFLLLWLAIIAFIILGIIALIRNR